MVDIFMESLLGALVQFGAVVTHRARRRRGRLLRRRDADHLRRRAFDPRLMWDAAAYNAHRPMTLRQPLSLRPV